MPTEAVEAAAFAFALQAEAATQHKRAIMPLYAKELAGSRIGSAKRARHRQPTANPPSSIIALTEAVQNYRRRLTLP